MRRSLEPLLIEPLDDGGFESDAMVAEGVIRLELDMCGLCVSRLLKSLEQCFAVRPVPSFAEINKARRLPIAEASFRKSHSLR